MSSRFSRNRSAASGGLLGVLQTDLENAGAEPDGVPAFNRAMVESFARQEVQSPR